MDRENVIKGLEDIQKHLDTGYSFAIGWKSELIRDALALLKEQEAVLLTFEEVKNHFHVPIKLLGDIEKYVDFENDIEPLYLECDIEDAWTVHWRTYDNTKEHLESWEKDYGKTWRCWTKKPTEEQKRSVKWE